MQLWEDNKTTLLTYTKEFKEIAGSYGKFNVYGTFMFNYIRNYKTVFPAIFTFPPAVAEGSNCYLFLPTRFIFIVAVILGLQ